MERKSNKLEMEFIVGKVIVFRLLGILLKDIETAFILNL